VAGGEERLIEFLPKQIM